jgi:NADPH-dependent 2,4-dienoyl-CoA reductase/sulfur reductase-like enzyme
MKLIVLGGGAAGMSAASKAKRSDPELKVTVIESGNYVSYAECGIPYYLSGDFDDLEKLIQYPLEEFTIKRGIDIKLRTRIVSINRKNKTVKTENGEEFSYDKLLIATGASTKFNSFESVPGVFSVRTLDQAIKVKQNLKGDRIVIVGDGILGMELSSEFQRHGKHVTLISKHDSLFPKLDGKVAKYMIQEFCKVIEVKLNSSLKNIIKTGDKLNVFLENETIECDLVFFATGIVPNTEFLKDSEIPLTEQGLIVINNELQTSDPDIYAAGDCATSINRITGMNEWQPLAQIANKMGRIAGSNITGKKIKFKGGLNTTLVKIMDYEVGMCGFSNSEAEKHDFKVNSIVVEGNSRADYYKGGSKILVKIVYDVNNRQLLGAQICGKDNCAWRLNTIETAIYGKLDIDDLFQNDLGYTPPFGPVWDPIIIAASLSMRD